MKVSITVKANARKNEVRMREDGGLLVLVTSPPVDGKANKKLVEILAEYFGKPKSSISIISGQSAKHKIVDVQ